MILKLNISEVSRAFIFLLIYFINISAIEVLRISTSIVAFYTVFTILSIFSLITIVYSNYQHNRRYSLVFFLSLLVFLYLVVSSFRGIPIYGLTKSYIGLMLPITIVAYASKLKWEEQKVLNYTILMVFLVSLFAIEDIIRFGFAARQSRYGLFGAITFGWITSFGFLAVILKKKVSLKSVLISIYFVILIISSGSKGPLTALIITLLLYYNKNLFIIVYRHKIKIATLVLIILISKIIDFNIDDLSHIGIRQLTAIVELIKDPAGYIYGVGYGSFGLRLDFFQESLKLFIEKPIFGNGFGSFSELKVFSHKYPHNVPIEMLLETGLVGVILIISLLLFMRNNSRIQWLAIFGFITLFFSGDFSYFRYGLFFMLFSLLTEKNNSQQTKYYQHN